MNSRPRSAMSVSGKSISNNNALSSKSTINPERREKLKTILIEKYIKKYPKDGCEQIIRAAVTSFLEKEKLTEKELKELDKRIELMCVNPNMNNISRLKQDLGILGIKNKENLYLDDVHSNASEYDIKPKSGHQAGNNNKAMSVISISTRNSKQMDIGYKDDMQSLFSGERPVERLDFDDKGEWDAIAQYNKKAYKDTLVQNQKKEQEKKNRTKTDLFSQIDQKNLAKSNLRNEDKEYGVIVNQHVDYLTSLEQQKILKEKEKIMNEKRIRDEQLLENKKKKKNELKSQREYDNNLLRKIRKDAEEEALKYVQKKQEKHDELLKTLIENDANKRLLEQRLQREREDDIKCQVEYARVLDKQEQERAEYFKSKERKGNTFTSYMVENVIKEQEAKNKKLNATIDKYQAEKDKK